MKQLFFLIFTCSCIVACSDDDKSNVGFSQEELSPIVTFTQNNRIIKISGTCSGLWESYHALNEKGEEIEGKSTKSFGSVIDSINYGWVRLTISKWVNDNDIDYVYPYTYFQVVKSETFKSIFNTGERLYAKSANPIFTSDEVLIEYSDGSTVWSSSYLGNYYSTPSYATLQPSANFTITRSMPMGNDSVFVEAKFKVRLYKNVTEYFDITDGYFKGFFYRKLN